MCHCPIIFRLKYNVYSLSPIIVLDTELIAENIVKSAAPN